MWCWAPVLLPYAHRPEHLTIVGGTGTGKTTLLERLVRQDIIDHTACVVFDVHGDMTDNLLRFAASQPAWAARTPVVELDPIGADPPFGANLYEVPKSGMAGRAIDGVEAYLRRFWGEAVSGPLIESGLTITTRTMVANPGYTMAEVPLLYANPALRAKLLKNIPDTPGPDEPLHNYWREYSTLTRSYEREMWRRSIVNKLERFLGDEVTYPVLAQERSTIAWEEILNGGYCLLIRLPLSAGERSTEQLNALLVNLLSRQLAARAGTTDAKNRPRVHVYLDEYRRLASEQTTTLLYEARKANVGVTVAMQSLADLESEVGRDAVLQTATRLAFRTTVAVAKVVAIGFAPPPRQVAVKKGICQTPVDYLVSHTHPNPTVRALTQQALAPLLTELELASGTNTSTAPVPVPEPPSRSVPLTVHWVPPYLRHLRFTGGSVSSTSTSSQATRLSRSRSELNGLFVDVMEGRERPGSRQALFRLLDVFFKRFTDGNDLVCIAATTARAVCPPGTPDGQALADYLGRGRSAVADDFAHLCLGDDTASLHLLTVKQSGLTGAVVQAADTRAEAAFRARQRQQPREAGEKHEPLPCRPRHFYDYEDRSPEDRRGAVSWIYTVAKLRASADPKYTTYFSRFERATFWPGMWDRTKVAKIVAGARKEMAEPRDLDEPADRARRVAFVNEFGESALIMGWILSYAHLLNDRIVRYWSIWREPELEFPWPMVTGLPLATTLLAIVDLCKDDDVDWQPIPPDASLTPPSDPHRPGTIRIYHEIVAVLNQVTVDWPGRRREADLTARLLLYKAKLSLRDRRYAEHVLPDEVICPPGQWPDGPVHATCGAAPPPLKPLPDIVQQLRELLVALDIENRLYEAKEQDSPVFYEQERVRMQLLTQAQRATVSEYCRKKLLGSRADTSDEELRTTYPQEHRFLSDIHRLCELLAKEPIEVSAGPQEERPQTTADVINEVERQLTQLGTGEAYHALLEEDGTINTDKIRLLPPPDLPPGDPALIAKIRRVSRQRFSRPRAEIDAATRRRQDTTAGPAASPPPHQTPPPPPGAGTRPPPPDPGPPPIGRR